MVVEHHCAAPMNDNDQENKENDSIRLAVENWDAPIIVTTSVQFFESLFSSKPSRCRKLHNIARSVVIVDESQALPIHILNPVLSVMKELVHTYKVSFLLCSATQPCFSSVNLDEKLDDCQVREIAPNPPALFQQLKRAHYHFPQPGERLSWNELAGQIINQKQALIIVNTRRQAFELYEILTQILPESERESLFHLSSSMCAKHREHLLGDPGSESLDTVHGRLHQNVCCYLVSTQLVEAGVDIDFPVLFRAIGPLDSIVQAAGRCNREGRLRRGDTYVFIPDIDPIVPPGSYKTATELTVTLMGEKRCDN